MSRPTVRVTNATGRSLQLHLHQVVPDDGAGRAFLGRVLSASDQAMPDGIQLQAGVNHGVDREFFEEWRKQNNGLALLPLISHENEEKD